MKKEKIRMNNKNVGLGTLVDSKENKSNANNVGAGALESAQEDKIIIGTRWHATQRGITLIALIITIIILLILAGVTINVLIGDNGLFESAKNAGEKYEEAGAREKLEAVLIELQADKIIKQEYNEKEYINKKIQDNKMTVNGDIVSVEGYQFTIDRSVPCILEKNEKIIFDLESASMDLTINNVNIDEKGIADFSNVNNGWVKINRSFNPGNGEWEMVTKVFIEQYVNGGAIFGKTNVNDPPQLVLQNEKLSLWVSSNKSSWNVANGQKGETRLELNQWYWVKVKYDTQKYQVFISNDGKNYTQDIVVNDSSVTSQGGEVVIGRNVWFNGEQLTNCKINLAETYVKYETEYLFKGTEYLKKVVSE